MGLYGVNIQQDSFSGPHKDSQADSHLSEALWPSQAFPAWWDPWSRSAAASS